MTGVYVLIAVLVLSTVFGLVHVARSGRLRGVRDIDTRRRPGAPTDAGLRADGGLDPDGGSPDRGLTDVLTQLGERPGQRATLLQFSSAFCAPCRATRRILSEVAELVPGVRHVEVDAERHLELVRRLKVVKTPTTLVLDASARETARATGQPRKAEVLAAVDGAL